ncbi:MAG: aldehyde ferredoxin oxidoreductase family protein [bacterium]
MRVDQLPFAFIDLTRQRSETILFDEGVRRRLLGGRALNMHLLLELTKGGGDPLDPDKPLLIGPGFLTGLKGPSTARCQISGHSPETGLLGDSSIGGQFGAALKQSHFAGLAVMGRADKPIYLVVEEGRIHFRDASDLWGMDSIETDEELRKRHGRTSQVICIGPAGERLIRFAAIRSGAKSAAGRTGMGCLMGSKNLKAVVAFKNKVLQPARPEEFNDFSRKLQSRLLEEGVTIKELSKYGTPFLYDVVYQAARIGRVDNGLKTLFSENENVFPKSLLQEFFTPKRGACFSCPIACRHYFKVTEGPYAGAAGEGPEFGQMAKFGPECGLRRWEPILYLTERLNRWGMDSATTASLVAWVIELQEKGILKPSDTNGLTLTWGDEKGVIKLVEAMYNREGIGDILAEGARIAAEKFPPEASRYLSWVKYLPQSDTADLRFFKGFALGIAISTRGADHLRSRPIYEPMSYPAEKMQELYGGYVSPKYTSYKGKGRQVWFSEAVCSIYDTLGICKLIFLSLLKPYVLEFKEFAQLTSLAAGWEVDEAEIKDVASRCLTMERIFLAREGIRRKHDSLPDRFFIPLEKEDRREVLKKDEFNRMLDEYYLLHGWDQKTGIPLPETMSRLGLDPKECEHLL